MVYMTKLKKSAARVGAIASVFVCAATTLAVSPAMAEPACPDIEVVFARGTNDAPAMGRVGDALVDALRPQVGGRTVGTYPVNYPASFDFLTSADGAADAANHISSMASQCPSTRIVLGGYSQGAAVVDMLGGIPPLGNKLGGEIAPPLSSSLAQNVGAVVVYGNPSAKFSVPITNSQFGGRSIDICKDGDPICSDGRNPFAHSDYVNSGLAAQGANFVAGII
jgi:cutinase